MECQRVWGLIQLPNEKRLVRQTVCLTDETFCLLGIYVFAWACRPMW